MKRGHNESIGEKQKSCTKCDKGAPEISNENIDFTIRARQSKSNSHHKISGEKIHGKTVCWVPGK